MKAFIKTYFKKDLQVFKDEDLKKRMALVRKAVAMLEREHFNHQQQQSQTITPKTHKKLSIPLDLNMVKNHEAYLNLDSAR
jgi:hypothetical protein